MRSHSTALDAASWGLISRQVLAEKAGEGRDLLEPALRGDFHGIGQEDGGEGGLGHGPTRVYGESQGAAKARGAHALAEGGQEGALPAFGPGRRIIWPRDEAVEGGRERNSRLFEQNVAHERGFGGNIGFDRPEKESIRQLAESLGESEAESPGSMRAAAGAEPGIRASLIRLSRPSGRRMQSWVKKGCRKRGRDFDEGDPLALDLGSVHGGVDIEVAEGEGGGGPADHERL